MLYRLASALLIALLHLPAWAQTMPTVAHWERVGAEADDRGLPVVIMITDHDCGFCERMRNEFLAAAETRALLDQGAVARELPRDGGGKITDFDGERIRTRVFLSRYEVFATPTLLFLSPGGESLAPALVGYNGSREYAYLVSERLAHARTALKTNNPLNRSALSDANP